jgi:hypothetical protein
MSMRRFTRLTNAYSKKMENHAAMVALYFIYYNSARVHQTLRVTPAMEGWNRRPMSGPSKKSLPFSGKPEDLIVYVEGLRQQAEEFQRAVEEECRTVRALLDERVRQAKRRDHAR